MPQRRLLIICNKKTDNRKFQARYNVFSYQNRKTVRACTEGDWHTWRSCINKFLQRMRKGQRIAIGLTVSASCVLFIEKRIVRLKPCFSLNDADASTSTAPWLPAAAEAIHAFPADKTPVYAIRLRNRETALPKTTENIENIKNADPIQKTKASTSRTTNIQDTHRNRKQTETTKPRK